MMARALADPGLAEALRRRPVLSQWSRVVVVLAQTVLALALLLGWIFSDRLGSSASLWVLFLYSLPAEFVVAVVPHEVPLIYLATWNDPLVLALVAGSGTVLTEVINYEVVRSISGSAGIQRGLSSRPVRRLTTMFERAPFLALWIAGATPVIPFFPLRFLAVAGRYPRWRYLLAGAVSRTPRFYLTALLGRALRIPVPVIMGLLVVLSAVVAGSSVKRWLAHGSRKDAERS